MIKGILFPKNESFKYRQVQVSIKKIQRSRYHGVKYARRRNFSDPAFFRTRT